LDKLSWRDLLGRFPVGRAFLVEGLGLLGLPALAEPVRVLALEGVSPSVPLGAGYGLDRVANVDQLHLDVE
jgi:hypothetical protein